MAEKSIIFKNTVISYRKKGKGTALVFLHGFLENKSMWKDYFEVLSNTHTVIAIDLPGHGKSGDIAYVHTMEEMAEVVAFVLQHEKIRRHYLVGHSMGGYVSMAYAEKFPDRLKGLIMFHSTASADTDEKKSNRNRAIKVVKHNKELFINEAIPNLFNTAYRPYAREIAVYKRMAKQMSARSIVAALEGMKVRLDREIVLKFAPYPIHYIIGKKDALLPYKKLIKQSEIARQGSYTLLENVAHMGHIEARGECLKIVKQFVKQR